MITLPERVMFGLVLGIADMLSTYPGTPEVVKATAEVSAVIHTIMLREYGADWASFVADVHSRSPLTGRPAPPQLPPADLQTGGPEPATTPPQSSERDDQGADRPVRRDPKGGTR